MATVTKLTVHRLNGSHYLGSSLRKPRHGFVNITKSDLPQCRPSLGVVIIAHCLKQIDS